MTVVDLKTKLAEKEILKENFFMAYQQVVGQIELLRKLIEEMEKAEKK